MTYRKSIVSKQVMNISAQNHDANVQICIFCNYNNCLPLANSYLIPRSLIVKLMLISGYFMNYVSGVVDPACNSILHLVHQSMTSPSYLQYTKTRILRRIVIVQQREAFLSYIQYTKARLLHRISVNQRGCDIRITK